MSLGRTPAHLSGMNPNRQPKGIPTGGQFAASARSESGVALADRADGGCNCAFPEHETCWNEEPNLDCSCCRETAALDGTHGSDGTDSSGRDQDWGTVMVTEGSRTPWGTADVVSRPADGIAVVHTPSHGGIKLSPERNAAIPQPLRNASGWYEEDTEANIVGMYHPEAFPSYKGGDLAAIREASEAGVKNWHPDAYTRATGNPVAVEESSVLRDRAAKQDIAEFRAAHADEFVTLGNGDNHASWIPRGYAACKARMDATGEERHFLMPMDEVVSGGMYGRNALVDPARHLDVTDIVTIEPDRPWPYASGAAPLQQGDDLCIDYNRLSTAAQVQRARAELEKIYRWADEDGTEHVESVGEHLRRVGVVGKRPYVDNDKVVYRVQMPGSRVLKVSKAAYDAMTSVPDTSTETDRAYLAKERARVKHERARAATYGGQDSKGIAKIRDAEAEYQQAQETYRRLHDEESASARAWTAERTQAQQEAFARLIAERGITFED